jgi:dCMP deaminase
MNIPNKWPLFYIGLAEMWANKSKDRSTGVGAIIVGPDNEQRSAGYNGFPRGVIDDVDARHDRPLKYEFTEHAERNAIYNAARMGTPLNGCVMYLNWWPLPCPDCARAVIQSGIIEVIGPDRPFKSNCKGDTNVSGREKDWQESFKTTIRMFSEAGVKVTVIPVMDGENDA